MLKAILFDMDDTLIDWSGFKLSWREREAIHLRGVYDYINEQVIKLLKKYGGVPMPDWMVAILDGHEANAAGWQQCNSPKICGTFNGESNSGGIFVSGGVFDTMEKLETYMREGMKQYQDVCRSNPEFLNHPHPIVRLYASCGQTYLSMGGHANAAGEVIFVLDFAILF